jgi:hypothetical protein
MPERDPRRVTWVALPVVVACLGLILGILLRNLQA